MRRSGADVSILGGGQHNTAFRWFAMEFDVSDTGVEFIVDCDVRQYRNTIIQFNEIFDGSEL